MDITIVPLPKATHQSSRSRQLYSPPKVNSVLNSWSQSLALASWLDCPCPSIASPCLKWQINKKAHSLLPGVRRELTKL